MRNPLPDELIAIIIERWEHLGDDDFTIPASRIRSRDVGEGEIDQLRTIAAKALARCHNIIRFDDGDLLIYERPRGWIQGD